jgi:hypothetical protein
VKWLFLKRVVTGDGCGPLLFYLMVAITVVLLGYFADFWVRFGAHMRLLPGL